MCVLARLSLNECVCVGVCVRERKAETSKMQSE